MIRGENRRSEGEEEAERGSKSKLASPSSPHRSPLVHLRPGRCSTASWAWPPTACGPPAAAPCPWACMVRACVCAGRCAPVQLGDCACGARGLASSLPPLLPLLPGAPPVTHCALPVTHCAPPSPPLLRPRRPAADELCLEPALLQGQGPEAGQPGDHGCGRCPFVLPACCVAARAAWPRGAAAAAAASLPAPPTWCPLCLPGCPTAALLGVLGATIAEFHKARLLRCMLDLGWIGETALCLVGVAGWLCVRPRDHRVAQGVMNLC